MAGFVVAMLVGFAMIATLSIGLGFLVTHVLEHAWGIGAANERVDVWLAAHRTSSRTEASFVGSTMAGGLVLPVLVGAIALVCAALRKWRPAAFVAGSRMYRGMHHPLDVAGGIVVGIAALAVIVFACCTAAAASRSTT